MRRWIIVLFLAIPFATILSLQGSLSAQTPPSPEQKIAAQVNGKTITYQELDNEFHARTRVPFEKVQDDPDAQKVRKQILEQIIDEELLMREAERQKMRVTPEMVDERFKNIRDRFPSEKAFNQALDSRGITVEKLRDNITKGLLRQQIIDEEVLQKVSVSPGESQSFFQEHKDDYVQEEAVHARHILFRVAADASPEDDHEAKDRANAVLTKAKKGDDFAKLAQEFSEGPTKEKGGDLGGTWYWNRYPGVACDIESYVYLPLLEELGYIPKEKYSRGAEILAHRKSVCRPGDYHSPDFRIAANALQSSI